MLAHFPQRSYGTQVALPGGIRCAGGSMEYTESDRLHVAEPSHLIFDTLTISIRQVVDALETEVARFAGQVGIQQRREFPPVDGRAHQVVPLLGVGAEIEQLVAPFPHQQHLGQQSHPLSRGVFGQHATADIFQVAAPDRALEFADAIEWLLSAMGQQSTVMEAVRAGARDFVVKPANPDRVLEALNKVLA